VDLSTIDNHPSEKGVQVTIKDTDGNDTDIKITVIGMKSNKAQKAFLANKDADSDVKFTALLTIGWENILMNGKEIKFSQEEAIKLYDNYPLIGNQVSQFILNEQNFLKKN
jgi:hypothetical protein